LANVTDLVLIEVFYNLEMMFTKRSDWWKVDSKIDEDLENLNYEKIKRALAYLRQKGLVETIKANSILPKISQAGLERVHSLLPHYDEKRFWDGNLYLITYDLPIKKNRERNSLRDFLKKIGCGMLQQSLWITPYNPTELLKRFVTEKNLSEDLILVSSLGKKGTMGGMSLPDLIEKVYCLSKINREYEKFLFDCREKREPKPKLIFQFLSILENDPQLPFDLLPEDWQGEEAYRVLQSLTNSQQKT